MAALRKYIKH